MKHTEEQLKRALVDALPDKLTYHQFFRIVGWKWENRSVTPHEWPAIVGMIEDRVDGRAVAQLPRYSSFDHAGWCSSDIAIR
jgi:hypothetical protein